MAKPKSGKAKTLAKNNKQRTYLSQSDVPLYSLEKALKIPQAMVDNYGKGPAKPLEVAKALEVAPANTYFKMQAGAAIAYGLTLGGWNAAQIAGALRGPTLGRQVGWKRDHQIDEFHQ